MIYANLLQNPILKFNVLPMWPLSGYYTGITDLPPVNKVNIVARSKQRVQQSGDRKVKNQTPHLVWGDFFKHRIVLNENIDTGGQ
jgi:hypothetical protein